MELIFRDKFWSAGQTEILDGSGNPAGTMDLGSSFSSKVALYDVRGELMCRGKFQFGLIAKWQVYGRSEQELGCLRSRLSFISKRFEYEAYGRGSYEIISPAFSREYEVTAGNGQLAAEFQRVNGFFSSGAYRLVNHMPHLLDSYELAAVIMGINAIHRMASSNSAR